MTFVENKHCLITIAAAAGLGWAGPVVAQEQAWKFEITPYAAYPDKVLTM